MSIFLKVINLFIILLFLSALISCSKEPKGGVIYTFDDGWVNEWHAHRSLFKKYNIKATFFISRPQLLDSVQIGKLKDLSSDGHEIACHGWEHRNVLDYVDSVDVFLEEEIYVTNKMLDAMGFDIVSYAYPFGKSFPEIDSILLETFEYIRNATWNIEDTTIAFYDEIYESNPTTRIMNSMGIDYNYSISLENFESGINRAWQNDQILVLHAHKIDASAQDYTISAEYLENTFKICSEYNVKSIRIRDIGRFY